MLKVGSVVVDDKTGKNRKISYSEIEYDSDDWADANKYYPEDFDLVYLKIANKNKNLIGWIVGEKWDGLRIKKEEEIEVTHWKRKGLG